MYLNTKQLVDKCQISRIDLEKVCRHLKQIINDILQILLKMR